MTRIALATNAEFPELFFDDDLLREALVARGADAVPAVWDDAGQDWTSYDLVVVRSTWDYTARVAEFLAWAGGVPRLANPANVLRWNTDKRYLRELSGAGVPVVPTRWLDGAAALAGVEWDDVVVKPNVSAGAADTLRCAPSSAEAAALAEAIAASGRVVMVQPYLDGVEGYGERSLLFAEGTFTHAVRRNPALSSEGFTRYDAAAVEPTDAELDVARRALAAVGEPLLYARVDIVPGPEGPVLMELEVTEPQLFLRFSPSGVEALADAVVARAGSAGSSRRNGS